MTRTDDRERIDFAGIAGRADLRGLIESELGPPARNRRWLCPFHDDHNPDLALARDGRRFKCWSCGASGTALDWIMQREGVGVVDAARLLDPTDDRPTPRRKPVAPPEPRPAPEPAAGAWHDPSWQAEAEVIIAHAERQLWSRSGREALGWLLARGLAEDTIRRFRLGFLPDGACSPPLEVLADEDGPHPIRPPRGITIPWVAPGSSPDGPMPRWVGCNVRRLLADLDAPAPKGRKYQAFAGSERGHGYPWPEILPTQGTPNAMIVEGEFDALLSFQELGHLVFVLTVGGSNQSPHPTALSALARCPWWLLALDHDQAGTEAAARWRELAPHKSRRAMLTMGKDPSEFVERGGNLREWLTAEFVRVEWH